MVKKLQKEIEALKQELAMHDTLVCLHTRCLFRLILIFNSFIPF